MFSKEKSSSEKVADWATDHTGIVAAGCIAVLAIGVVAAALVGDDEASGADS